MWSDKGVADIVGTILILAITVVLFSSIMAFVLSMPVPTNKPIADFRVSLDVTGNKADLTILHNGGQNLFAYTTDIFVSNGTNSRQHFTLANGGIASPASNPTWAIGQIWLADLNSKFGLGPNRINSSTQLEVDVIDIESNSMIWSSMVGTGTGNNAPVILQRWADGNTTTLTVDPIVPSTYAGFSLYVRVTDSDGYTATAGTTNGKLYTEKSTSEGVWLDVSSISGLTSPRASNSSSNGVWRFDFPKFSNPSTYDGKPLIICVKNNLGPVVKETYILTVQQPDVTSTTTTTTNANTYITNYTFNGTSGLGDSGLPLYIKYHHGDQGYVVLGEDKSKRPPWGKTADINDPKTTFIQGQEWVFIRVASLNLKNVDARNNLSVVSYSSGQKISPPSNSSGFYRISQVGNAWVYEAKFNSSLLAPGGYFVEADLMSSASEGTSPSVLTARTNLSILPQSGQQSVFIPTVNTYDKNRRALSSAKIWGTETTNCYDLSDATKSLIWVEVTMQDVGTASSATVSEVRIEDLRDRSNLYGKPPTGDGMISSLLSDAVNNTYVFSMDLRLKNGMTFTSGISAYSLTLTNVFDANEGVYTISVPIWIKYSVNSKNFIVGTSGFGFGKAVGGGSSGEFEHMFQIENNKFFTTRILDWVQDDPGQGPILDTYKTLYFDMDEDGDRDALAAILLDGNNYLAIYINRMNEYGLWEQRSIFSNYTTTGSAITSMAYGDVDGDGDQDWIVSNAAGNVYLYINDYPIRTKALVFKDSGIASPLRFFNDMQLVDMNGDGKAELVGSGSSTGAAVARGAAGCKLYIYNLTRLSSGNNTQWVTKQPVLINGPIDNGIYDFDTEDIESNGTRDIAITSALNGVNWYKSTYTEPLPGALVTADPGSFIGSRLNGTTFANTTNSDNSYEELREAAGALDYIWPVSSIPSSGVKKTLYVEASVRAGSSEGFNFYYSTSATGPWIFMFSYTSTDNTDLTHSFPLSSLISGTVYVRVTDGDTSTDSHQDTIYIDRINVRSVTGITYITKVVGAALTTYTCIGIGNLDGSGWLDIAIGKAGSFRIYPILSSGVGVFKETAYATLSPDSDTFVFTDINGDSLSEVVSVSTISGYDSVIVEWLNLGNTFTSVIAVKDLYTTYGSSGAAKGRCDIRSLNVGNMYG